MLDYVVAAESFVRERLESLSQLLLLAASLRTSCMSEKFFQKYATFFSCDLIFYLIHCDDSFINYVQSIYQNDASSNLVDEKATDVVTFFVSFS